MVFYLNHRYSNVHNRELDENRKPNIGFIMFFPYIRVIPMHLTIVVGAAFVPTTTWTLLLFLGLKTLADGSRHKIDQSRWRD